MAPPTAPGVIPNRTVVGVPREGRTAAMRTTGSPRGLPERGEDRRVEPGDEPRVIAPGRNPLLEQPETHGKDEGSGDRATGSSKGGKHPSVGGRRIPRPRLPGHQPGGRRNVVGLADFGLARLGGPVSFAVGHIPFMPRIAKRIAAIFGACCGPLMGCSCCGCLGAFAPLLLLIVIIVGMVAVVSNNPAQRLLSACRADRGENDPICRELEERFKLTVSPGDMAAAGVNVDEYRDLEARFGIPWFYLAAAEKVATNWGQDDFSAFANNVAPPPALAVAAHERTVTAASVSDAPDAILTGSADAIADTTAADIIRLSSPLRGSSYGLMLINTSEYERFGLGLPNETATGGDDPATDASAISAASQSVGIAMSTALGGTGQAWIAFASQAQREGGGVFVGHNPFNLTDDGARTILTPGMPTPESITCSGPKGLVAFGQTDWWIGGAAGEYHCFATFSSDAGGGAAAAQNYLSNPLATTYGYGTVVTAARSGNLDATARAIECSAWSSDHYGATCPDDPGALWSLAMGWADANPGVVGSGSGCTSAADCTAEKWLDPWVRADAGEIASRALLAAFAELGKSGELRGAPEMSNVPADVKAVIDMLLDDYVAAEDKGIMNKPGCEAINKEAGLEYPGCNDGGATLLDEMIGFQPVGVGAGPISVCVDGGAIGCLPRPKYDPSRPVLFGDGTECGNIFGWRGWPETWPSVGCYRPYPVGTLADIYSSGMAGRGIEPATRYYVCMRLMSLRASGVLLWGGQLRTDLSDADRATALGYCQPFADITTSMVTLPKTPSPTDDAKTLAAALVAATEPYYVSSDTTPTVTPGSDVRDWTGLSKIMRSLYASPDIWGGEQQVLLPMSAEQPVENSIVIGETNAYVDAIDRYARTIYDTWAASAAASEATSAANDGAADAMARAQDIDLRWWAESGGLEKLLAALLLQGVVLDRAAVEATLIADGAVHDTTLPASPGCRPYTMPGAVAIDGTIGDRTLSRYVAAVAADGDPAIGPGAAWAFSSSGTKVSIDPLLLAAIALVNGKLDLSTGVDPADPARTGVMGLRASDVTAFGPSATALGVPPDAAAAAELAAALGKLGISASDASKTTPSAVDPRWAIPIAAVELAARAKAFGSLDSILAAFRSDPATVRSGKTDATVTAWVRAVRNAYSLLAARAGAGYTGGIGIGSGGIGGCWRYGTGIPAVADPVTPSRVVAATTGSGPDASPAPADPSVGVAMNFCLPELADCGTVRMRAGDMVTWLEGIPVVDYLDGDIGSPDEVDVAIRPGTATALGLTGGGPWKVDLMIVAPASGGSAIAASGGTPSEAPAPVEAPTPAGGSTVAPVTDAAGDYLPIAVSDAFTGGSTAAATDEYVPITGAGTGTVIQVQGAAWAHTLCLLVSPLEHPECWGWPNGGNSMAGTSHSEFPSLLEYIMYTKDYDTHGTPSGAREQRAMAKYTAPLILAAADEWNLDPWVLVALIVSESAFSPGRLGDPATPKYHGMAQMDDDTIAACRVHGYFDPKKKFSYPGDPNPVQDGSQLWNYHDQIFCAAHKFAFAVSVRPTPATQIEWVLRSAFDQYSGGGSSVRIPNLINLRSTARGSYGWCTYDPKTTTASSYCLPNGRFGVSTGAPAPATPISSSSSWPAGYWTWPKELTFPTPAAALGAITSFLAPQGVTTPRTFANMAQGWATWSGCLDTGERPELADPLSTDAATATVKMSPWCAYLAKVHATLILLLAGSFSGGDAVGEAYGIQPRSSFGYVWPVGGALVGDTFAPRSFAQGVTIGVGSKVYDIHNGLDMVRGSCGSAQLARVVASNDGYLFMTEATEGDSMPSSVLWIIHDDGLMTGYGHVQRRVATAADPQPSTLATSGWATTLEPGVAARFRDPANIYLIDWGGSKLRAIRVSAGESISRLGKQQGQNCHLHFTVAVYSTSKASRAAPPLMTFAPAATAHYQYAGSLDATYRPYSAGCWTLLHIDPLEVLPKDPSIDLRRPNPVYKSAGGWPAALRPDLLGINSPERFIKSLQPGK